MRRRRVRNVIIILVGSLLAFVGAWQAEYPQGEAKNLRYILWKRGLFPMDLDRAAYTMIGDAERNKLVIGKTEEQLRKRFGYLLAPDQSPPYLRA